MRVERLDDWTSITEIAKTIRIERLKIQACMRISIVLCKVDRCGIGSTLSRAFSRL